MAPNAQKVPENVWDAHKNRIVALVQSHTKSQIRDILGSDYGLDVTLSQLEAKLRAWHVRKNLSKAEWHVVLRTYDEITATGKQGRVLICGRIVQGGTILRARRHCGSGDGRPSRNHLAHKQKKVADLSQVQIEILHDDGRWHLHTDFQQQSVSRSQPVVQPGTALVSGTQAHVACLSATSPIPSLPVFADQDFNGLIPPETHHGGVEIGMAVDYIPFPAPADFDEPLLTANFFQDSLEIMANLNDDTSSHPYLEPIHSFAVGDQGVTRYLNVIQPASFQQIVPHSQDLPTQKQHEGLQQVTSTERLPLWHSQWLRNLPFRRFERRLEQQKEITLAGPWLMTPQLSQTQLVRQDQLQAFMRSLDRGETISLATNSAKISRIRWIQSALGSFMIQTTATKTTENHRALISEQDMFNTHFNKILISSLANGCAGLQDVPIGSVLKHLMRYRHTSSVLLDFLRQSDTYVAKGLAENLFRAAIEARDVVALQVMLRIPSVDVNNILCFPYPTQSRGIKPIFRAAKVESLDMVRALRKAGAIAENSSRKHEDGCLFRKRIIQDQTGTGYSTEDSALVDIAQELLLAGFEPTYEDIDRVMKNLLRSPFLGDLVFILASKYAQHSHHRFFLSGVVETPFGYSFTNDDPRFLLYRIVADMKDIQATVLIRDLIEICKREHDGACLSCTDEPSLGWVLTLAAETGKLEVVRLLLLYTKNNLYRAFTAAIRSRNNEIIDAILDNGPDVDAPADTLTFFGIERCYYVTSFSEAITTGNDKIIQLIQDRGHLGRLEHGSRFHPAVTAAAKTNDMGLLRGLLERYHHPHPAELGPALIQALKHENKEAAMMLLDAGASTSVWYQQYFDNGSRSGTDWNVLLEALKDRNSSMVYALLDAAHEKAQVLDDEYYSTWYGTPEYCSRKILRAAVVWGDEPITTALLTTFPTMLVEYDELAETIENNNLATFNFLVASRRVTPSALCDSLQYAIRKGDENMIKTFLDLGADCTDNGVLKAATNASLPILELVLSKPPTLQRLVAPGNGRDALERAIRKGTRGLPMVQRLLQSNAVGYGLACLTSWDEESCQIAPLGLAIKQCCEDNDGDLKVVKLFLDAGQHPDSVVKYEHDLYPDFPPELKGPGCQIHYRSNTTALLLSIEYRNTRLIKLLLDRGANVDLPATCRILRTPLQKACEVGSLEIVQLLLDSGANPSSKPARCQGATALQLAAISGNCNIAAELLGRGADLDQPPVKAGGRWPLEGAAEHGRLEMIEFLWKASGGRGFDKPICDFAIKVAEQRGHSACRDLIKDLMENGVSEFDSDLMSDVFGVIP